MKTRIAALLFAAAMILTSACEQHKWEGETQKLFKDGEHGEKAGAEHGKADSHDEKKADEAKH